MNGSRNSSARHIADENVGSCRIVRAITRLAILALSPLALPLAAQATTVTGRVTSHLTGQPLDGIRLSIWYQSSPFTIEEIGAPVSAADGSYAWTGVCAAPFVLPCHVTVDDERYIRADVMFSPAAGAVTADMALVTSASIAGDIRIDGAIPNRAVAITITRHEGDDWYFVPGTRLEQAGGHYVIDRVPPAGDYRVCAGGLGDGLIEQCFDHHDRSTLSGNPAYDPLSPDEGETIDAVDFDLTTGGRISGTLHDGFLGEPLADTAVYLNYYDAGGTWLDTSTAVTDSVGAYSAAGLPAGTYYLLASISSDAFYDRTQVYPGIVCDPDCPDVTAGQALTVSNGTPLSGIDFTVHPSAVIRGRVTDAATGDGLGNIHISKSYDYYASAVSAASGDYMFYASENLLPFRVLTAGSQPYIDQVFPGIACIQRPCSSGEAFSPARGSVFDHVDFSLQTGAAVSGTVVDAISGLPRYGTISMYDSAFNLVWTADLDGTGSYVSGAWYPGTYYVKAEGYPGYLGDDGCAFYDGRPCPADGQSPSVVVPTPITIGAGEIRTGINFQLLGDLLFSYGFDW